MDLYDIIISPKASEQLNSCINYIRCILMNETAAKEVYNDAVETGKVLAQTAGSLQYCENKRLRNYGYRAITFRRHQYVMIYRIEGQRVYVDSIFHQRQDYEAIFAKDNNLK